MPEQPDFFQWLLKVSDSEGAQPSPETNVSAGTTGEAPRAQAASDVVRQIREALEPSGVTSSVADVLRATILADSTPDADAALRDLRRHINGQ